jgi:hypothetical protein
MINKIYLLSRCYLCVLTHSTRFAQTIAIDFPIKIENMKFTKGFGRSAFWASLTAGRRAVKMGHDGEIMISIIDSMMNDGSLILYV